MSKKSWFITIWDERKYFDCWTIVHFLTGVMSASFFLLFDFMFISACIIFFFLNIIWEAFEHFAGIGEYFSNKIADIIITVFGLIIVYLFPSPIYTNKYYIVSGLLFLAILNMWGIIVAKVTSKQYSAYEGD